MRQLNRKLITVIGKFKHLRPQPSNCTIKLLYLVLHCYLLLIFRFQPHLILIPCCDKIVAKLIRDDLMHFVKGHFTLPDINFG